ncbi:hypothetical protein ALC53_11934 [Atta colombica]|uniref:Uncharacterized protein n=1 Tax=Atta colombica TaxID=520822 RepID=A0A195AZC5_9HYME|nr:hypothetical protein ALC53_11934 [Atta colombica]
MRRVDTGVQTPFSIPDDLSKITSQTSGNNWRIATYVGFHVYRTKIARVSRSHLSRKAIIASSPQPAKPFSWQSITRAIFGQYYFSYVVCFASFHHHRHHRLPLHDLPRKLTYLWLGNHWLRGSDELLSQSGAVSNGASMSPQPHHAADNNNDAKKVSGFN